MKFKISEQIVCKCFRNSFFCEVFFLRNSFVRVIRGMAAAVARFHAKTVQRLPSGFRWVQDAVGRIQRKINKN